MHQWSKIYLSVIGFQWILSGSVVKSSCGISVRNGKWVAMMVLISVRLLFCLRVRFVEKFMMGKNMSEFGKVTVSCLNGAFNCLQEVCWGSWSWLFKPMERMRTSLLALGTVFFKYLDVFSPFFRSFSASRR